MSICPKCGLPEELCTCNQLIKEEQLIKVKTAKRRYGKPVTIVTGIDFNELGIAETKELLKTLKKKLACGGTLDKEHNWIELQGSHKKEVEEMLVQLGYKVEGYESKSDEPDRS